MADSPFLNELRKIVRQRECALVIGAGITMGAMSNSRNYSWAAILQNGLECCVKYDQQLPKDWLTVKLAELQNGDVTTYLALAYEVETRLRKANHFTAWIKGLIKPIKAEREGTLDRIKQLDAIIATTNYDDLLATKMDLQPVTWMEAEDVQSILRKHSQGIIHMHGHWSNSESIVFGVASYYKIQTNEPAQTMQQMMALNYHLIFVGFGEGMHDPNFELLIDWMGKALGKSHYDHYVLVREEDHQRLDHAKLNKAKIRPVIYGKEFKDLDPFLDQLKPDDAPATPALYQGILPKPRKQLIDRQNEKAIIKKIISGSAKKVITLRGAPGIGTSFLALHIANELQDEEKVQVHYVSFSSIENWKLVATEIGLAVQFAGTKNEKQLINYLATKKCILLLDNFEGVVGAADFIKQLANECPQIKIIITSQFLLNLDPEMEHVEEIRGLEYPKSLDDLPGAEELLQKYPSIQLFVECARQAKPKFSFTNENARDIAELCMRVDGIPKAIEIVAADMFLASEVLTMVRENKFEGLESLLDWSYKSLSPHDKAVFRMLSVFEGGFALSSVSELLQEINRRSLNEFKNINIREGLKSLSSRSLLEQTYADGKSRFSMLETVRRFGISLYTSEEAQVIRFSHATVFLKIVKEAEIKLTSMARDQANWLEKLDAEYENLRSVLEWCRNGKEYECEKGLEVASYLFWYWNFRGRLSEGFNWIKDLYDRSATNNSIIRAMGLYTLGGLAFLLGDYAEAENYLQDCVKRLHELGEQKSGDSRKLGLALIILGVVKLNHSPDKLSEAREHLNESIKIFTDAVNNKNQNENKDRAAEWGLALALNDLGRVAMAQGNNVEARKLYTRSLEIWEEMGDSWGYPLTLGCMAELMIRMKSYEEALDSLQKILSRQPVEYKWGRAIVHKDLGKVYFAKNDFSKAAENLGLSLKMHCELNRRHLIAECLEEIARLAIRADDPYKGITIAERARILRNEIDAPNPDIYRKIDALIKANPNLTPDKVQDAKDLAAGRTVEAIVAYAANVCRAIKKQEIDHSQNRLVSQQELPENFTITIREKDQQLSFEVKGKDPASGAIKYCRYDLAARDHDAWLDLFEKLAADFGLRLPQNRLHPAVKAALKTGYRELLTANLDPRMLHGYGDPAAIAVTENGGKIYYLVSTSNDAPDSFPMIRSKNMVNWEFAGFIFPKGQKPAWAADGELTSDYWAPEIHKVGNEYRLYFVARHKETSELCIGLARSANAQGPYIPGPAPILRNNVIDPHIFIEDDENVFLCWKEDNNAMWPVLLCDFLRQHPALVAELFTDEHDRITASFMQTLWPWAKEQEPMERFMMQQVFIEAITTVYADFYERLSQLKNDQPQKLQEKIQAILQYMKTPVYLQQLSPDGTELVGEKIKIIENDLAWEAHLVEGIWITRQHGKYYLFYAGNDFSTEQYGIGVAVAGNLKGPYKKMPKQLLQSTEKWRAPGHPSVVDGPDGKPVLLFHAFYPGHAGYKQFRALLAAQVSFHDDGVILEE